jgi:tRNA threonylcarbamoyladenosine biosynthesis protein TsaE
MTSNMAVRRKKQYQVLSSSSRKTQLLGYQLGKQAQAGDIYLLTGNLGAGKTCLTQGIARGLDIEKYAHSPSFILMREYHGRLSLYHMDLYRLDNVDEIMDLGLDDYIEGNGLCVIEWADRGIAVLPQNHLMIKLEYISQRQRKIMLEPHGDRYEKLAAAVIEYCKSWN